MIHRQKIPNGLGSTSIFVLWQGALERYESIENHFRQNFIVLAKFDWHWSEKHYNANIARLYNRKNTAKKFKKPSKKFGIPPYKVFIVQDTEPDYGYHVSTSGIPEFCNLNFIEAKNKFRQGLPHPYLIHCTSTDQEFSHQLSLLFGSAEKFMQTVNSGDQVTLYDLNASDGWLSWEELYSSLESNFTYALLRKPPDEDIFDPSFDLDILTDDFQGFASLANVTQRTDKPYKGTICVGNRSVKVDLRFIGDDYFPEKWQVEMLRNRVVSEHKLFKLSPIDQYFSILYHGLLHKSGVDPKYYQELGDIESEMNFNWSISEYSSDDRLKLLNGFMLDNGYFARLPLDPDVGTDKYAFHFLPLVQNVQTLKLRKKIKQTLKKFIV